MFVKDEALMFYDKEEISPRWNVILAKSSNIGYQHLTFVNSCIWTRRGGTHADSVLKSIADKAMLVYNKRFKDPD
jgi:DNA gyrase/topoisomerase IV subunit B